MEGVAIGITVMIVVLVAWFLVSSRRRQAKRLAESAKTAPAAGLSTIRDLFEPTTGHHAPVSAFHVRGEEIQVTFDVPLPDEPDPILEELLIDEAIEVVREKRHTLPIEGATEIVVLAGRGEVREVGRTKLPAPGELPPRTEDRALTFTHIAHDPFAAPFAEEVDHSVHYEVRTPTPGDELGPLAKDLQIPKGLERGLRALGVNPETTDGGELIVSLLRMFGYGLAEQAYPGSYMALKDGLSTYILTEPHSPGESPEITEPVIRRFLADFGTSGADRGLLISEKYAPFAIHEIESRQPKVRFITRERIQSFIDGMALG